MAREAHQPMRFLSTEEAARSLGVSSWWVRERIEMGLLPALVIKGRRRIYRIRADDWAVFCARHTGQAHDPHLD